MLLIIQRRVSDWLRAQRIKILRLDKYVCHVEPAILFLLSFFFIIKNGNI